MPENSSSASRLSRRGFLTSSLGFGAGVLTGSTFTGLAGAGPVAASHNADMGLTSGMNDWRSFQPGAPLIEPEVRRSVNGVLETTLRCVYNYLDVGGYRLFMRTYEGVSPGPTFRVKPGDTLKITLINDLPPVRDLTPSNVATPHQFNVTNLHTHGLHVNPGGIADNVMRVMEPGKSYDIAVEIPANHVPGTNWYHPHAHGSANVQMASGMVAALIIEGDFADVPEITQATERVLILQEAVFDAFGTIEDFATVFPEPALRFFTVNGQREPTITMRPGEVQRWRIVQASHQDDMFLELEGHRFHQIARDGIPLARMDLAPPHTSQQAIDNPQAMITAPGQRIDVLVKAGAPGTYALRALPYDQGYPSPTGPVARLVVEGDPLPMELPKKLPPPPTKMIEDKEITGTRTLTLSQKPLENDARSHWQEFRFLVDGKTFDHNRIDQRVPLGAVEEWTVLNEHVHDHAFHIHTNDMLVTKINGQALPEPIWMDTVIVPRWGSMTFRSRFEDFTGLFMLHCHMMNHEELGMMQTVEVYSDTEKKQTDTGVLLPLRPGLGVRCGS